MDILDSLRAQQREQKHYRETPWRHQIREYAQTHKVNVVAYRGGCGYTYAIYIV